jgi:hypothetical protein
MSDPSPLVAPPRPDDLQVYRPLSGLAIAGLALALLYVSLVLISSVAGLVQGAPFYWPGWMVLLAIAGAGLSLLALRQIRRSEGTRAGAKVAQWGLGLSVVAGLGYTAYDFATSVAVKQQANRFLMEAGEDAGFFPLLEKGDVNAAFLLTQTYSRRSGANARDEVAMYRQFDTPMGPNPTGLLTQFNDSTLVRVFQQARLQQAAVQVEPAGARGWDYESKGYKVERRYRITTPEMTLEWILITQSTETGGAGRKWFVVWNQSHIASDRDHPPVYSAAGEKLLEIRRQARTFLDSWLQGLKKQPLDAALIKFGDLAFPVAADGPRVRALFVQAFQDGPSPAPPYQFKMEDAAYGLWEMTAAGRLQIAQRFQISLGGDSAPDGIHYLGRGRIVVETAVPGDPRTTAFTPEWHVVRVELERAVPRSGRRDKR